MLDLNVDASSSGDEVDCGKAEAAADSVASTTTTTSANNNAAADEADCSSWTREKSASTLNFAILNNDVIEIEDDPDNDAGNELQLFPIANSPSPAMVRAKYWLNLSVPEVDEIHFRVSVNSLSSMLAFINHFLVMPPAVMAPPIEIPSKSPAVQKAWIELPTTTVFNWKTVLFSAYVQLYSIGKPFWRAIHNSGILIVVQILFNLDECNNQS
ncbi:hypothetical protein SASPL_130965 [Salvia splendens]|uniref:Uncharacterized protein n=1 Tax=Salvia splendens TaxID=180675 RepID=A0A8X8X8C3_SALSN|nr:hypothetical protein SASPL_130965 [Salvia splendens]